MDHRPRIAPMVIASLTAAAAACAATPFLAPRAAAQAPRAFCLIVTMGQSACYTPAERATPEALLPVPPLNPDAAVTGATTMPLAQVFVDRGGGEGIPVGATPGPVVTLGYIYGSHLPLGILGECLTSPYVVIEEHLNPRPTPGAASVAVTDQDNSGRTVTCRYDWGAGLPGHGLSLSVSSNAGADNGQAAAQAIGAALQQQASDLPTVAADTATATPAVTPTATAMPSVTANAQPVGTTVATAPSFTLTMIVERHDSVVVHIRTAPRARVDVALQLAGGPGGRGRAPHTQGAHWATVARQRGEADAHGAFVRHLRVPDALARATSARMDVTVRAGRSVVTRIVAVRLLP